MAPHPWRTHEIWNPRHRFLIGLQERLQPGASALVILVEHDWVHPLSEALAGDDARQEGERGVILQQTLTDQMVEDLLRASEETAWNQDDPVRSLHFGAKAVIIRVHVEDCASGRQYLGC